MGIINFGTMYAIQISMNGAVRDAARAAVVQAQAGAGMTCDEIATRAQNSARTIYANPADFQVTVTATTPANGVKKCTKAAGASSVVWVGTSVQHMCDGSNNGILEVTLNFDKAALVPLVPPNPIQLTSRSAFRCEYK